MVVFSLVCSARPVSPFGNLSSSVGEEGALISWEYWGPEKNIYVEYIVENSKQRKHYFCQLHAQVARDSYSIIGLSR